MKQIQRPMHYKIWSNVEVEIRDTVAKSAKGLVTKEVWEETRLNRQLRISVHRSIRHA